MAEPQQIVAQVESTATRRTTPCGDGHMVWRIWGGGDPVVFLHGGMGSWMHWIRNIPELSKRFTMLVPDMPGHMESSMPTEPYSPEVVADVLVRGIGQLLPAGQRYSVVGFSFGSAIAGHVARLAGERVRNLVLLSPGGLGLRRGETGGVRKWRHIADPAERMEIHRNNLQVSMISDPAHVDDLAVFVHATSTEAAMPVSAPISLSDTLQSALPQVKANIVAMWGVNDPASAPFMDERRSFFRSLQPDAPIVMLEDASHWAQYEASDQFNAQITPLLSRA